MGKSIALLLCLIGLAACGDTSKSSVSRQPGSLTAFHDDSITLPDDTGGFGDSADGKLLQAKCTACHSASMVLGQPPLSSEQWAATVKKMREAYKAPLAEGETQAIVRALSKTHLNGR